MSQMARRRKSRCREAQPDTATRCWVSSAVRRSAGAGAAPDPFRSRKLTHLVNRNLAGGEPATIKFCNGAFAALQLPVLFTIKVALDQRGSENRSSVEKPSQRAWASGFEVVVPDFVRDGDTCVFDVVGGNKLVYVSRL